MAWICVERIEKKMKRLVVRIPSRGIIRASLPAAPVLYPKIVWKKYFIATTKKMFRLTHRESGGEKKKTWLWNQNRRIVTTYHFIWTKSDIFYVFRFWIFNLFKVSVVCISFSLYLVIWIKNIFEKMFSKPSSKSSKFESSMIIQ